MGLSSCFVKAGKLFSSADKATAAAKSRELRAQGGLTADDAARQAVDDMISEALEQIESLTAASPRTVARAASPAQALGEAADGGAVDSRRSYDVGTDLDGSPGEVMVDGVEVRFGGFKPAQAAATAYAKASGLDYTPPSRYASVDAERATRIADAYEAMPHEPDAPEVAAAYNAFISETLAQYEAILKTGLKVEFIGDDDPYVNPRNAIIDVTQNRRLSVFPTASGFGSDAMLNIGLDIPTGGTLSLERVRAALKQQGARVVTERVHKSDSEQTLVAWLQEPLTDSQAEAVSAELEQEAIVQVAAGKGQLYGPKAGEWGPYSPGSFVTLTGKRADRAKAEDMNPLLRETQYQISGRVALANDIFRVVHDYFGHVKDGVGFRAAGEENAWRSHAAMYTPLARRAMATETRGQNSWVNYGPSAAANRTASAADTTYAPQKVGLMPEWVSEEGVLFSDNANPHSLVAGRNMMGRLRREFDAMVADYERLPETEGGRILNADFARELSPEYRADRSLAQVVHAASSVFIERYFQLRLTRPIEPGLQATVYFTAGGSGAGKSSGLPPELWRTQRLSSIVVDGTLSTLSGARRRISYARANGYDSVVAYTYRDPAEAWVNGVLKRALGPLGRIVPASVHISSHVGSRATVEALINDAEIEAEVYVIDNSRGPGGAVLSSIDKIPPVRENEFKENLYAELEKRRSEFSARAFAALVGGDSSAAANGAAQGDGVLGDDPGSAGGNQARDGGGSMALDRGERQERPAVGQRAPRVKFSDDVSPLGFYSALLRKLDAAPNRALADQWKAYVNGLTSKGVKQEEVQWTGLFDWLDLQSGKIEKSDVQDFLRNNGVRVSESVLGMVQALGDEKEFFSTARYHNLTLAGGSNYREILLTVPPRSGAALADANKAWRDAADEFGNADPRTQEAKADVRRESLIFDKHPHYQSPHWSTANVLAHIRVNDRKIEEQGFAVRNSSSGNMGPVFATEAEANEYMAGLPQTQSRTVERTPMQGRVLFVEELQSDWAQEGRKKGFRTPAVPMPTASPAPFVGKTDGWLNLALKRIIKMAVDDGYTRIAFVSGEQSAERYDLSKTLVSIEYKKLDDGQYRLDVLVKGGAHLDTPATLDATSLEDYVGKELAHRVVETATSKAKTISGDGLRVGGEGMKTFYDSIVPNAAKALTKKLGGRSGITRVNAAPQFSIEITPEMRGAAGAGLPLFSDDFGINKIEPKGQPKETLARSGLVFGRDELGKVTFAPGTKLYNAVGRVAKVWLDKIALAKPSEELTRSLRAMRTETDKMLRQIEPIAKMMGEIPEGERELLSDMIEGLTAVDFVAPQHLIETAASMSAMIEVQTAELVRLGMLSAEDAAEWAGKYLPRFYSKKLAGQQAEGAWEKALAALGRPKALRGVSGKNLHKRGIVETVVAAQIKMYESQGWKIDDPQYDPSIHDEVQMRRDYTPEERAKMGEIRDAMFRFVLGYAQSQKDVSLGRLYERISKEMATRTPREGYVRVPDTKIDGLEVFKYGKLAGMYVPPEVLDHVSATQGIDNVVWNFYKKALGEWKGFKTALNFVSHANNIVSNVTMAHFAGVSYWRPDLYADAARDMMRGGKNLDDAQDAGLFGGSVTNAEIAAMMPPELEMLLGEQKSAGAEGYERTLDILTFFLRKPLMAAYKAEDSFFKYVIYRDARSRGLSQEDSVAHAARYIFEYDMLPATARWARDLALPFFSYTYLAFPALAHTAANYPWRMAAPAAVLSTASMMAYALLQGDDDDDWLDVAKKFALDEKFRDAAFAAKKEEEKDLPEWMKGRTSMLTPKAIRLGSDKLTGLPVFIDVARMIPGGDIAEVNNNTGGVGVPQPIMPSNPLLSATLALLYNKDPFFGKELTDKNDELSERVTKRLEWAWAQFSPAVGVGGYIFNRTADAVAYETGKEIPWVTKDFTGTGKNGLPVQGKYAALQNFGVKAGPVDLEMSAKIDASKTKQMIRDMRAENRRTNKLRVSGAMSEDQANRQIERNNEKIERLRDGKTVDGDDRD